MGPSCEKTIEWTLSSMKTSKRFIDKMRPPSPPCRKMVTNPSVWWSCWLVGRRHSPYSVFANYSAIFPATVHPLSWEEITNSWDVVQLEVACVTSGMFCYWYPLPLCVKPMLIKEKRPGHFHLIRNFRNLVLQWSAAFCSSFQKVLLIPVSWHMDTRSIQHRCESGHVYWKQLVRMEYAM